MRLKKVWGTMVILAVVGSRIIVLAAALSPAIVPTPPMHVVGSKQAPFPFRVSNA